MACPKCNTCEKCNCGGSDAPLTTQPVYPAIPPCTNPEVCSQIWDAHCVIYNGDAIANFDINPGDRMDEVMQKLMLGILTPACVDPLNTCTSVLNVRSGTITDTSIIVAWDALASAPTSYDLEYATSLGGVYTTFSSNLLLTGTITGLTPDTDYFIRVTSVCAVGSCASLVIKVRTKLI